MKVIVESQVVEFIEDLDVSVQVKVQRVLDLLEQYGNRLPMPYSKSLKHKIFELRTRGKQEIRLLYGFRKDGAIVVYGFIKKTQKTPKHILDQAIARLEQWPL